MQYVVLDMVRNFNPRSPHGERPDVRFRISAKGGNFNPRSPHGERHGGGVLLVSLEIFQSTLPARGATTSAR